MHITPFREDGAVACAFVVHSSAPFGTVLFYMNCRTLSIALWFFSTGGIGTTIFYVLGSLMIVGAVVLMITRKRMGKEN